MMYFIRIPAISQIGSPWRTEIMDLKIQAKDGREVAREDLTEATFEHNPEGGGEPRIPGKELFWQREQHMQ